MYVERLNQYFIANDVEDSSKNCVILLAACGSNLIGRDWLSQVNVNMGEIFSLQPPSAPLKEIIEEYPNIFSDQLGCLKVHLNVNQEACPKFFKPRPVPLAFNDKVEKELDRLVAKEILSPVQFSKWAAPIAPVVKHNGSIRICGDFKVTINQVSRLDSYSQARIEELFAKLSGVNILAS